MTGDELSVAPCADPSCLDPDCEAERTTDATRMHALADERARADTDDAAARAADVPVVRSRSVEEIRAAWEELQVDFARWWATVAAHTATPAWQAMIADLDAQARARHRHLQTSYHRRLKARARRRRNRP